MNIPGPVLVNTAEKKRYCLDGRTATAHFPGIGRYVVNLARALGSLLRHDEELVVLRDPCGTVLFDGFSSDTPNVLVHDAPVSPFSLRQQWVLPGVLRRLRAHAYHSPYMLLPFFPGVPTIVTVHDLIPMLFPNQSSRKAKLLFRCALFGALRTADTILAVSQSTRDDLLKMTSICPDKVATCLEAAAPEFSPAPEEAVSRMRRTHALPEPYILYAGSNKPHKNLAGLLDAWKFLRAKDAVRGVKLVIAGVWLEEHALPETELEGVRVLGRVDDDALRALYSDALVFVFPTYYEGFGLPVLEAMACGAPVVCSRCSSLPEVAGNAALFFDPNNSVEIAEKIKEILHNEAKRLLLRAEGKRRVTELTWERGAACTLEIYRSLASPPGCGQGNKET